MLLFSWINATDVWAALAGSTVGFLFLHLYILSPGKAAEATGWVISENPRKTKQNKKV